MNAQVQTRQTYAIDSAHSSVGFVVRHLMISKVRGRFAALRGSLAFEDESDLPVAVEANIEVASIDTREPQRDAHLRSADFFEAERFPEMTFASTRIVGTPADFRIEGDLTIRGETQNVVLRAQFEGRGQDPWGGQRVSYSAAGIINRKNFGLNWNQALETGGVLVSDEVQIELDIQAVLQQ